MRKVNPLSLYPAELRRKIKLPKSLQPPAFPSMIGLTDKKIAEYYAEQDAYWGRVQVYLADVYSERFKILSRHYNFSANSDLLLEVLFDFVPGFQIETSKTGPREKWCEPLLIKLAVEVGRIRNSLTTKISDFQIMQRLSKQGFFKGINPRVLQNKYLLAKKLPLGKLAKALQVVSEDVRICFIKEIESAAEAAVQR